MDYKTIIIIILLLILIYYNIPIFNKMIKKIKIYLYPRKYYEIKSDLSLVEEERIYIQNYLSKSIYDNIKEKQLKKMCLYALNNGKRIRPIIIISIYKKLNGIDNNNSIPTYVINAACGIEYIHCASLIIDDIMDNDDERRGKTSMHIKYGLTMTQLCAIILCTLGMQQIAKCLHELNKINQNNNKNIPFILYKQIFDMLGELSIGQFIDTNISNKTKEYNKLKLDINDLINKKTSSLFEFCYIIPWIITNCEKNDADLIEGIKTMKIIAQNFGLLFQISDDFEDVERDRNNFVMNYVIYKGYKQAYYDYKLFMDKFFEEAQLNNIQCPQLDQILAYLTKKVNIYYKKKKYIV